MKAKEQFTLVSGEKDGPLQEVEGFEPKKINKSTIEEERVFSKGEIVGLIKQISKEEGLKPESLEIEKEVYDREGNLIHLSVRAKPQKAANLGWSSISYDYMIKGDHEGIGFTEISLISRVYNLEKGEDSEGGIVARYVDGKWELDPDKISPKAVDIEFDD